MGAPTGKNSAFFVEPKEFRLFREETIVIIRCYTAVPFFARCQPDALRSAIRTSADRARFLKRDEPVENWDRLTSYEDREVIFWIYRGGGRSHH